MTTRASLPLTPLMNLVVGTDASSDVTITEFARRIGSTTQAVNRWRRNGRIPWVSADEAAVAIGLHPILVWGDDWLNVKGDFDRLAAQATADLEQQMVDAISCEGMDS